MDDRLVLEATDSDEDNMVLSIDDGRVCVAVSEEKAVDSYNSTFECTMHLTHEQAIQMRDWLVAQVIG